jgi:hypothetical protein
VTGCKCYEEACDREGVGGNAISSLGSGKARRSEI